MKIDWILKTVFAPYYIPGAILPGNKETYIPGRFTGLKWVSGHISITVSLAELGLLSGGEYD